MPSKSQTLLSDPSSRSAAFERAGCELIADSLRGGRPVRMRAGGSSMVPALWPGDELQVMPPSGAEPACGEIVLYLRDGRLFAHRVVARAGAGSLITRGDSLAADDPPVQPSEFLGIVAAVFRDGREIPLPARAPSRVQRMMSSVIRRSQLVRRVVLKLHAIRRRPIAGAEIECRV